MIIIMTANNENKRIFEEEERRWNKYVEISSQIQHRLQKNHPHPHQSRSIDTESDFPSSNPGDHITTQIPLDF
jgi:hypothetical protein